MVWVVNIRERRFEIFLLYGIYLFGVHMCVVMHMPRHACRGQRMTWASVLSFPCVDSSD